jgi:DNA repair photolyase
MANKDSKQEVLFPILMQEPALRGAALAAAEADEAGEGHLIEFRAIQVRSITNKSVSKRMHWTVYAINPYRGCEFGCRYCYARYTHTFLAATVGVGEYADPNLFERRIFIKQNAAWLLTQELRKIRLEEEISLGTATDPYQPIERRAMVTRSILEVLAKERGRTIGMVTKSTLVVRDVELLQAIARQNRLTICVTITTPDIELARKLEPRAPRPDLRFAVVKRLRQAGLRVGVLNSPLLPGITDNGVAISEMARRAKEADACFLGASPIFLKDCSRPTYFDFVRQHFPELMEATEKQFGTKDFAASAYAKRIRDMANAARKKHNIGYRMRYGTLLGYPRKPVSGVGAAEQTMLFG